MIYSLEQAEAKAKEIIDSYNDFCQKTYGVSLTSNRWASTPSGQQLIQSLVSEGAGRWVKASDRLQTNDHEFVFLKGCRVDKGILRKETINLKDYVVLYFNDGIGTEQLSIWEIGHKELENIYWLDESGNAENVSTISIKNRQSFIDYIKR